MKKWFKKMAWLLSICMLITLCPPCGEAFMATETPQAIIERYVGFLDSGEIGEISDLLCDEARPSLLEFVSVESNEIRHKGYFNYQSAEFVLAQQVEMDWQSFGFYSEDYMSVSDVEVWECIINVKTYEETEYLVDGYNRYYFVIGWCEETQPVIVGVVRDKVWSEENCEEYVPAPGISLLGGYDQKCFSYQEEVGVWKNPTEITVRLSASDGGGYKTLSFKEYCYIVTMYEYGSNSLNQEARKASALAIKNVAWQRIRLQKYANEECDITCNEQKFGLTKTPTSNVKSAVDAIWNYIMLSSDYKLFFAYFQTKLTSSGIGSYAKYHGGCLSHLEADALADDGYTWEEILHYFYDYGEINTKMTSGVIRIVNLNHVEKGSTYVIGDTQHWKVCTVCGCIHYKASHRWAYFYNDYYRCVDCAHVKYVGE